MRFGSFVAIGLLLPSLAGCGQEGEPAASVGSAQPASSAEPETDSAQLAPPPVSTVSMTQPADDAQDLVVPAFESATGTAEWALAEITRLRAAPMPDDPKAVAAYRRDRNRKIVGLATQAIAATHADSEMESQFNSAVHQLMETQLELALLGKPDDIDALFDAVGNLEESHPKSRAAEEAGFTLARYAHANARRFAAVNPETLLEFSRQARIYADMYDSRVDRAAPVLYAAARSCEKQFARANDSALQKRLRNEARLCYTALKEQFPDAHQGVLATAVLRRLNLPGQELTEFSGPTLDGRLAKIQALRGRVAVLVFWSSENERFNEQTDALIAIVSKHSKSGVYMLGVNMDTDRNAAEAYIKAHRLPGKHIYFTGNDQQRWESPIARYWGVQDIPSLWVVDREGIVLTTDADVTNLNELLVQAMTR